MKKTAHYVDGPQPLEVQLSYTNYGYAQVFLSGVWVPIADSWGTWTMDNSKVVCRQLGYNGYKDFTTNHCK